MFYGHFHICVWDLVDGYKFLFEALWLGRRLGRAVVGWAGGPTHYTLRFGEREGTRGGCQHSPNDLIVMSTPPRAHGNILEGNLGINKEN